MPILASDLSKQIRFALDAEGADHYKDDEDIIPAINAAQRWLVSVINKHLSKEKFTEESFSELSHARVFQTSQNSRIQLDVFPHNVWSILAVYPLPETKNNGLQYQIVNPDPDESYLLIDLFHVSSEKSAKRLTVEEWATNRRNPFEAGYEGDDICDDLKDYAYLDPIDYNYDGDELGRIQEIEIRPKLDRKKVTVFYVQKPEAITQLTDNILFTDNMFQMLFNKALEYISYKQGDNTTLFTVTQKDISDLYNSI